MGAKFWRQAFVGLLAIVVSGCATAERLLPAGLIKQEDLEQGVAPNPVIAEAVANRRVEQTARYPDLSEQPMERPTGLSAGEKDAWEATLRGEAEALETAVAKDWSEARAARSESLDDAVAALEADIADDRRKAEQDPARTDPPRN